MALHTVHHAALPSSFPLSIVFFPHRHLLTPLFFLNYNLSDNTTLSC